MTKYPFWKLNILDKQEYHRLTWQEYRKTHDRKDYFRKRYEIERNCSGISWANRKLALPFRKEQCEICGDKEKLVCHHKDQNQVHNTPDNIQTLCMTCHVRVHKKHFVSLSADQTDGGKML
jgi:5-methylcytosine-specific restriction endonuclease McrA